MAEVQNTQEQFSAIRAECSTPRQASVSNVVQRFAIQVTYRGESMKKLISLVVLMAFVGAAGSAVAAGSAAAGKTKSAACAACHGEGKEFSVTRAHAR